MNTKAKLAVMAVLAGTVMVASAIPAAADTALDEAHQQYREAMWYFVPTVGQWSREVVQTIQTAQLKPEQACKALPELAYRGQGMVEDLSGTTPTTDMAATHAALMGSIVKLTNATRIACGSADEAAVMAKGEMPRLNQVRQTLLGWLLRGGEAIEITIQPVVGN